MDILGIRTFIPAKDFELSKRFYKEWGFNTLWESDDLIILGNKTHNFFLQKYYNEDWANNFMMQLHTSNIEKLFDKVTSFISKYEGTKINDIFDTDYGRTFHVIDPSGVLWHITEVTIEDVNEKAMLCDKK